MISDAMGVRLPNAYLQCLCTLVFFCCCCFIKFHLILFLSTFCRSIRSHNQSQFQFRAFHQANNHNIKMISYSLTHKKNAHIFINKTEIQSTRSYYSFVRLAIEMKNQILIKCNLIRFIVKHNRHSK